MTSTSVLSIEFISAVFSIAGSYQLSRKLWHDRWGTSGRYLAAALARGGRRIGDRMIEDLLERLYSVVLARLGDGAIEPIRRDSSPDVENSAWSPGRGSGCG